MTPPEENAEKERHGLSAWLDSIQQDSWQLELIISGFVVFLLIGGWDPIMGLEVDLQRLSNDGEAYFILNIFYYTLRTAYQALLFCLLVHVLLRGLWIAAIGLRYVSGEIDYEALKYQPRYINMLRDSVGSFDGYIERLERYCSVIFSLAFLIIFCFLSLATYFFFAMLAQLSLRWLLGNPLNNLGNGVSLGDNILGVVFLLMGLLYFIDFLTLGWLKKNRWTARPYYYVYRFMGWITLARFYRPLYHNLIDQRFGRRLARLLPLFVIACLVVVSIQLVHYTYFPHYARNGKVQLDRLNYDDTYDINELQFWRVTLKSKYPENNYLEVFAPYRPRYDDQVLEANFPDLPPARYPGVKLRGAFSVGEMYNAESNHDSLSLAMNGMFRFYLNDSLRADLPGRFHFHAKRQQPGLLYMLPTHDLPVGEHTVMVARQIMLDDSLSWRDGTHIYFYK